MRFKTLILKNYEVCASPYLDAVKEWTLGRPSALLALYKKGEVPLKKREPETLQRAVMLSADDYEKFAGGEALKSKEPLQSWTQGLTVGTPYRNQKKPIYLMFKHHFAADEIIIDLTTDFPPGTFETDNEEEIICKSVSLSKKDLLWEPFIIEDYIDEDEEEALMERFPELTVNDPNET